MRKAFVTGGAGFFGGILKRALLNQGWHVISIDLEADTDEHINLKSIQGDIRSSRALEDIFSDNDITVVFHVAAMLAHAVKDKDFLWASDITYKSSSSHRVIASGVRASEDLYGKMMNQTP